MVASGILLVVAVDIGCAPRPLLTRAIRARGGILRNVVRESEVRVYATFPGDWRWRTVYRFPLSYGWAIYTAGDPMYYLFDGTLVRSFIGTALISTDGTAEAPLRTQAGFAAVVNLDALQLPGADVAPIPAGDLPRGW